MNERYWKLLEPIRKWLVQRKNIFRVHVQEHNLDYVRLLVREQGKSLEEVLEELIDAGVAVKHGDDVSIDLWNHMTPRERQISALYCMGMSYSEIARELGISLETVKTHIKHIFFKMNVNSGQALKEALKGWDFGKWVGKKE